MKNRKKITYNLFVGIGGQLITICLGIILPRLLLTSFGSEVNGLVSAVTQLYTYIAILEAGIGAASLNALYKCFANSDQDGVAEALSATKIYFRRVSIIYAICVILATATFPFVLDTEIDNFTVAAVVLLQGLSGLVNFYFVAAYEQLILADGKAYVSSLINLLVTVLSYLARIVAIFLGFNIIIVQTAFLFVSVTKALILYCYYKKKYPWIKYNKNADLGILRQRSSFMVHEISGVINHSSAVLIISIFCDLKQASIYAVYSLIYNNLRTLLNKASSSFDFYLGQAFHRSREEHRRAHEIAETYYIAFSFAIFTAAFCVTLPFIKLYTAGVEDANYIDVFLPYLFVVVELFSCMRSVSSKLILVAGHAQKTRINTIIEASITLVSSLILVQFFGVHGVLFGAILSTLYRTNDILIYTNIKILQRKPYKIYLTLFVNFAMFAVFAFLNDRLNINITSYLQFACLGVVVLICACIVFFVVNSIVRLDVFMNVFNAVFRRAKKQNNH